ncbi:hypothetical protein T439DRAFT_343287 [Meredithblackwellia eburnea MCA 4105]
MLLSTVTILLSLTIQLTNGQLLFPANAAFPPQHAFQASSNKPATADNSGSRWHSQTTQKIPKIAIIGAGAAGSSAAYFLQHFMSVNDTLKAQVTIYDKEDYIGGRSTVVWPWEEDPTKPPSFTEDQPWEEGIEAGASIFVEANKNLFKAARIFNLSLVDHAGEEDLSGGPTMTIWDGERFVYSEAGGWGYWDLAKMFWRYGRSPLYVRDLVKRTVLSFTTLYTTPFITSPSFPFTSLRTFSNSLNLSLPLSVHASSFFSTQSISQLFTTELIAAATTVNYGTPVSRIHGLGALVSLAANGAKAVFGGNRRIFEKFVKHSGATVKLGSKVVEIVKLDPPTGPGGGRAQWVVKTALGGATFDAVILAAPFHQTRVQTFNTALSTVIPPQPYVRLFVTFIITNATTPSPAYFTTPSQKPSKVSKTIFSTFDTSSPASSKPSFNSLNYLKALPPHIGERFGQGQFHVIKMFSSRTLPLEEVYEIFGGKENVGKVWEKVWFSYPKLDPVPLEQPGEGEEEVLAPVRPDEGFYYPNGFERLVSTMETETVASYNVVSLLLKDFYGYTTDKSWAEWDDE